MSERDSQAYCRRCFNQTPRAASPPVNSSRAAYQDYGTAEQLSSSRAAAAPAKPPRYAPQTPPRNEAVGYGSRQHVDISPSSVFSSGRRNLNLPTNSMVCPRCAKAIYHAEKTVGPGGPWHKSCFKCRACATALSSTNLTEHDGEAYCKTCHKRLFTPSGYTTSGVTETFQHQQQSYSPTERSSSVLGRSPSSLAATGGYSPYRRSTPSPALRGIDDNDIQRSPFDTAATAAASAAVLGQSRSPTGVTQGTRTRSPHSRLSFGRAYTPRTTGFGAAPADICPRCDGRIYAAEQGMAAGRKYHKRCIKCKSCNTAISSLQLTERNGEIFCKQCYARDFGADGFRSTLSVSTNLH
ncbi:hypothetical protein GGF46_004771 [Coemansia sp. RSA 552]|nr:hypothetical protein GGF46_004771 [Coemansia sp. RSA 552]